MTKARYKICICVLVSAISGCIIVGVRDEFSRDQSQSDESLGVFVPDYYIQNSVSRIYAPFFRIEREQPPHDLVLLLYDQTYMQTSRDFEKVILESMSLEYADGEIVELVASKSESERTYPVAKGSAIGRKEAKLTFEGAVNRRESIDVLLIGKAVKASGEEAPFRSKERHKFDGTKWTCRTIFQEWADC